MGVYDHLMRPSMGHKLQVDLRHSMQRYHDDKQLLQRSLSQLRLNSSHLHTSTSPHPSDQPHIKRWGDPNSPFSKAPEVAAHKARLAQLQQENERLSHHHNHHHHHNADDSGGEVRVSNTTLLPPITHSRQGDSVHTANTAAVEDARSGPGEQAPHNRETANKPATTATKLTTTTRKKPEKGRRFQKKPPAKKAKDKHPSLVKLPTIHSASERRAVWDSGRHHLQVQGPSTHLERNQVDEECRTFSHRSVSIPPIADARRTEIQRPPGTQLKTDAATKVQFRRHPLHPTVPNDKKIEQEKTIHNKTMHSTVADQPIPRQATMDQFPQKTMHSTPATEQPITRQPTVDQLPQNKPTVDHFPQNTPRLPELDDGSTDNEEESEDETVTEPQDRERVQRTSLPALPAVPQPSKSSSQHQTTQPVPPLRLQRGMTPSANSTLTVHSGATGATYMSLLSQDTQEWKGAYVRSEDPHHKARMLTEILHATRQRMQDNEEDLRLCGGGHRWNTEGGSAEVMLLHRDSTDVGSGANTARSSLQQGEKPLKLPHHQHKKRAARKESHEARLHRYLNKLSQRRRTGEGGGKQRHHRHHQLPPSIPLAAMTIREITQSSLGHQSAVHTAS